MKGWMIGLALIASFGEAYLLVKISCSVGFACSQIRFSSFVYNVLIDLWLSQHIKKMQNLLTKIGICSFSICFSHIQALERCLKGKFHFGYRYIDLEMEDHIFAHTSLSNALYGCKKNI